MSTIPKDVLEKAIEYGNNIGNDVSELMQNDQKIDPYAITKNAFLAGYQLATDGREELEKEKIKIVEQNQIAYDKLWNEKEDYKQQITALQSSLTEKDRQYDLLLEKNNYIVDKSIEKDKQLKEKEKDCEELKERFISWAEVKVAVQMVDILLHKTYKF